MNLNVNEIEWLRMYGENIKRPVEERIQYKGGNYKDIVGFDVIFKCNELNKTYRGTIVDIIRSDSNNDFSSLLMIELVNSNYRKLFPSNNHILAHDIEMKDEHIRIPFHSNYIKAIMIRDTDITDIVYIPTLQVYNKMNNIKDDTEEQREDVEDASKSIPVLNFQANILTIIFDTSVFDLDELEYLDDVVNHLDEIIMTKEEGEGLVYSRVDFRDIILRAITERLSNHITKVSELLNETELEMSNRIISKLIINGEIITSRNSKQLMKFVNSYCNYLGRDMKDSDTSVKNFKVINIVTDIIRPNSSNESGLIKVNGVTISNFELVKSILINKRIGNSIRYKPEVTDDINNILLTLESMTIQNDISYSRLLQAFISLYCDGSNILTVEEANLLHIPNRAYLPANLKPISNIGEGALDKSVYKGPSLCEDDELIVERFREEELVVTPSCI